MFIKIKKSELNALQYVCSLNDLTIDHYTMEESHALVCCEIRNDGRELLPGMGFYLGRQVEIQLERESLLA